MSSSDSLRDLFGPIEILWQNLSGAYAIGLERQAPIRAVLCFDDSPELDEFSNSSGVRFLSAERSTRRRVKAIDPDLDSLVSRLGAEVDREISSADRKHLRLVTPRPAASAAAWAASRSIASLAPSAVLCNWLNHKPNFFAGLDATGLPRLAGRWIGRGELAYSALSNEFGARFVVQRPSGERGNGTAIIASAADLAEALPRLDAVELWAAPFVGPNSLNVNACALPGSTLVSWPSLQLTGWNCLGARPGAYCGNDFTAAAALPTRWINNAFEQTERLGRWLAASGFRGLFGLDFLISEELDQLFAVDLNPRWQGSTALDTMAATRMGKVPLAAVELAWQCGVISETDVLHWRDSLRESMPGSQMFLASTAREFRAENPPRPGAYRFDNGLKFVAPAVDFSAFPNESDLLLCGCVARPGTTIETGSRLSRIISLRQSASTGASEPLDWAEQAVRAVYGEFGLPSPHDLCA